MGFKNDCWCTVWADKNTGEIAVMKENYAELRISISKKSDKTARGYETIFREKVRFVGKAFKKLQCLSMENGMRLNLLEVDVQNVYVSNGEEKYYTNFVCWDFALPKKGERKEYQKLYPESVVEKEVRVDNTSPYKLEKQDLDDLPF